MQQRDIIIDKKELFETISFLSYYPKNGNIAVAVSGGADSLCLAILLKEYCMINNHNLIALVVDHKLRKESTEEAQYVYSLLKQQQIRAVILTREEVPLASKMQAIARQDRYKLLGKYCKENNISHLFVAHHFNDQIETIMMREEKGEHVVGSAGISAKVITKDYILLRPFLNYSKQEILNTLLLHTKQWVEDPSNQNIKYHRVRIRNLLKTSTTPLCNWLHVMQMKANKRLCVENNILYFLSQHIKVNKLGIIKIKYQEFIKLSITEQIYVLGKILKFIADKPYPPKQKSLRQLREDIVIKKSKKKTLGHCIVSIKKEEIIVLPEYVKDKRQPIQLPPDPSFKRVMHEHNIVLNNAKYFYDFTLDQLYNYEIIKQDSLFANLFVTVQKRNYI